MSVICTMKSWEALMVRKARSHGKAYNFTQNRVEHTAKMWIDKRAKAKRAKVSKNGRRR